MRQRIAPRVEGDYIKILAAVIHIDGIVHGDGRAFSAPNTREPARHYRFCINHAPANTLHGAGYTICCVGHVVGDINFSVFAHFARGRNSGFVATHINGRDIKDRGGLSWFETKAAFSLFVVAGECRS